MKYSLKTALTILAASALITACEDDEPAAGFALDTREITVGAVGGTENIRLESAGAWTANTESPWITVSPVNGTGSVNCQIKIDTTLLADDIRQGMVRFISSSQPEPLDLRITQTGFENMITLSKSEIEIPDYGEYGKRTFEVELTSNVDFKIVPSDSYNWVTIGNYDFDLDRGSRPRTVKIRVNWQSNTRPSPREAIIEFQPAEHGLQLARQDKLTILQKEAPKIEDNRQGDSLAIVGCARVLDYNLRDNEGESMDHWDFVKMWEPKDKGFSEDKRGRVRSVNFRTLSTREGIPYEIQFLTKAEEIILYSNGNAFLQNFSSGEYLAQLTQLKRLEIFSFGLIALDDSFRNLRNLEFLSLAGNNFNEVPGILTPENFPNLIYLDLAACRRNIVFDMSTTTRDRDEWGGFRGEFPEWLLHWDKLEYLSLSNNYIYGKVPDMQDYANRYTSEEIMLNDTLPNGLNNPAGYNLVGKPKILPNAKHFAFNLNLLEDDIPEWVLYHPNLMEWIPDIFIFNQDNATMNLKGEKPGFSNTPEKPDYYYEAYPLKKPEEYE